MKNPLPAFFLIIFSATVSAESSLGHERQSAEASLPQGISNPGAPYPPRLARDCIGGKVVFTFTVMASGKVQDVTILESPHEQFSRAVIHTVKTRWLFTPYTIKDSGELAAFKSYIAFDSQC